MFDSIKVARPFIYANDTRLLMALHDSSDNISLPEDLKQIFLWINQWDLLLNSAKCCHIHYSFSKSTPDQLYLIHDNPVSTNHDIKDLGIIYTPSLQWDLHYKSIISKEYKIFHVIEVHFYHSSTCCKEMFIHYLGKISPSLLFTIMETTLNKRH